MVFRTKNLLYIITGLLVLVLAACQQPDDVVPDSGSTTQLGGEATLANTNWRLVTFGEVDAESPVKEGTEITLIFQAQGEVGGSGGCNTYGGLYEVSGNTITFNQIVSTLMACTTEGVTEQETQYLNALQTTGEYELAGNQLKIWYEDSQSVMNFERME